VQLVDCHDNAVQPDSLQQPVLSLEFGQSMPKKQKKLKGQTGQAVLMNDSDDENDDNDNDDGIVRSSSISSVNLPLKEMKILSTGQIVEGSYRASAVDSASTIYVVDFEKVSDGDFSKMASCPVWLRARDLSGSFEEGSLQTLLVAGPPSQLLVKCGSSDSAEFAVAYEVTAVPFETFLLAVELRDRCDNLAALESAKSLRFYVTAERLRADGEVKCCDIKVPKKNIGTKFSFPVDIGAVLKKLETVESIESVVDFSLSFSYQLVDGTLVNVPPASVRCKVVKTKRVQGLDLSLEGCEGFDVCIEQGIPNILVHVKTEDGTPFVPSSDSFTFSTTFQAMEAKPLAIGNFFELVEPSEGPYALKPFDESFFKPQIGVYVISANYEETRPEMKAILGEKHINVSRIYITIIV